MLWKNILVHNIFNFFCFKIKQNKKNLNLVLLFRLYSKFKNIAFISISYIKYTYISIILVWWTKKDAQNNWYKDLVQKEPFNYRAAQKIIRALKL